MSGKDNLSFLPEIKNDIITGSLRELSNQSLAGNKSIYLAFVDSICWINRCETDSLGQFTAALPFDYQGHNLIITVLDTINNYIINTDNEFYPGFLKATKEDYYPDSSLKEVIESRMLNLQINDAYSGQRKMIEEPRPALRFYGYPDSEYKFRKYINLPTLEEFIFEIVDDATVVRNKKQADIRVFTKATHKIIGDNPMVIFDGIPLLKTGNLTLVPPEKLETVRVTASKFFFGTEVFDGVVDITSNTKSFDLADMDKNLTKVIFCPIITTTEKYETQNSRVPNYASCIYFNKIITVSGNKGIEVQLPQNAGNYSLSVFGYSKTGGWGCLVEPNELSINR